MVIILEYFGDYFIKYSGVFYIEDVEVMSILEGWLD